MKSYLGHLRAIIFLVSLSILSACAAVKPVEMHPPAYVPPTPEEIARLQGRVSGLPVGDRVAFWAESFVGAPYDTDPIGAYVRQCGVVCDKELDCMYHVFRSAELATSGTPEGAVERALELRFKTRGVIVDDKVVNYDDRFDYAEDMVVSGKWGEDVTSSLGETREVAGSRGRDSVTYMPKEVLLKPANYKRLKSGDLIFFVKDPVKRVVGEIVGHLGIIKMEEGKPFLIHASGSKSNADRPGGGSVRMVDLPDYLSSMKFIGVVVTRFPARP